MLGIIGIILAILFLMIGSYKGLSALPLTLLAALIVVLTNGMGLWAVSYTHLTLPTIRLV